MKFLSLAITKILLFATLVWFSAAGEDHDQNKEFDEDLHDEIWHEHYQFDARPRFSVYTALVNEIFQTLEFEI
eukprot:749417-Hanusia_phi.AAC.3